MLTYRTTFTSYPGVWDFALLNSHLTSTAQRRRENLSLCPEQPPLCPRALCCKNKIHFVLAKGMCKERRGEHAGTAEAHRYSWAATTAGITGPESLIENSSHNIWRKICPLHGKSMAFNWVLQAEKGRADNRSITSSVWTNLGKSLNPGWAQHTTKLRSWSGASPLPIFPAQEYIQSRAWSPFKEVSIDGWKPLQGDGGGGASHDLGGDGHGSWFLGGLPALVDQVQVAVHPGHLVGREGVGAVIVWNSNRSHISHVGEELGERGRITSWWRAGLGSHGTPELMVCEGISTAITCGGRWKETMVKKEGNKSINVPSPWSGIHLKQPEIIPK